MIRLMICFVRKEDISLSEFREYWRSREHHDKIASLVALCAPDRYADTLATQAPDIEEHYRRLLGRGTQYDAVVEFYWDDPAVVRERLPDRAINQILRVLRDHSVKRVDPEKSSVFLTEVPEVHKRRDA